MQLLSSVKNGNFTNNVYKVSLKQARNFISWVCTKENLIYENFNKVNYHAIGQKFSLRYNITSNLLTLTLDHNKK